MPCYAPIKAFRIAGGQIQFGSSSSLGSTKLTLPCGKCLGCRLERSRQWALRISHEASLHDCNCFITLTYNEDHLPSDNGLHYEEFQEFLQNLRNAYRGSKIRYYMCGEYGEQYDRPHYHACIFGLDFEDKKLFKIENNNRIYTSAKLEKIWGKGFCTIGSLTFESAAYVARYVMKKQAGDDPNKTQDYMWNGIRRSTEFAHMSLKPGIGATWFEKYHTDVYPHDQVISNGHPAKPPRYYDKLLKKKNREMYDKIKIEREQRALENQEENTTSRLAVKEEVHKARIKSLKRNLQ